MNPDHLPHAAIVDCTASETISDGYADFFRAGIHVVTPNKRAQSAPHEAYESLHELRRANGVHLLYETNVGAGLPVIETLRDLIATGDEVLSVEGIFSGTLAYLFNALDADSDFSQVVRQARDAGYTEPDPREDLSGMDVARKLLILARELKLRMDLADVEVESLAPEELSEATVEEFLDGLGRYDGDMRRRLEKAGDKGHVLRYVGRLDSEGRASVRLESLPRPPPLCPAGSDQQHVPVPHRPLQRQSARGPGSRSGAGGDRRGHLCGPAAPGADAGRTTLAETFRCRCVSQHPRRRPRRARSGAADRHRAGRRPVRSRAPAGRSSARRWRRPPRRRNWPNACWRHTSRVRRWPARCRTSAATPSPVRCPWPTCRLPKMARACACWSCFTAPPRRSRTTARGSWRPALSASWPKSLRRRRR